MVIKKYKQKQTQPQNCTQNEQFFSRKGNKGRLVKEDTYKSKYKQKRQQQNKEKEKEKRLAQENNRQENKTRYNISPEKKNMKLEQKGNALPRTNKRRGMDAKK